MSLYQVSENRTVLCFSQNQKAPNKVGQRLTDRLEEFVRAGISFEDALATIEKEYWEHKAAHLRGIDSVDLKVYKSDTGYQPYRSIYLSYRLNGTFATYTEYEPAAKEKGGVL